MQLLLFTLKLIRFSYFENFIAVTDDISTEEIISSSDSDGEIGSVSIDTNHNKNKALATPAVRRIASEHNVSGG